jgi:hypothetical protein
MTTTVTTPASVASLTLRQAAGVLLEKHPEWCPSCAHAGGYCGGMDSRCGGMFPTEKWEPRMDAAIRFLRGVADPTSPTREELEKHIRSLNYLEAYQMWEAERLPHDDPGSLPLWEGWEECKAATVAAEDLRRCF